ncbi:MAG: AlpA family phage regulatory protein [Pelodictyon phaeoclathratiforme]
MKRIQKLYRLREVIGDQAKGIVGVLPISRAAFYRGISEGRYPKPVKLSERSVAWREGDILELVERLSGNEKQDGGK